MENKITWEKEFSLITNRFILKDLFSIVFLSTLFFQIFLILVTFLVGEDVADVVMPLYVNIGILVGMSSLFLFSMLLLGNRYNAEFTIDEKGITYKSGLREKRINRILLFLMLLTKPRSSGSGFLAISGESGSFDWKEIYKIIPHGKAKVIEIKNSWRTILRLYCTDENFEKVLGFCNEELKKTEEWRLKNPEKISAKKPLYFYLLWIIFVTAFALCSTAWSYISYGDNMIPIIIMVGVLTIISGLAYSRGLSRATSLLAILGIIYFSYQLYYLAYGISEDFLGYAKYTYEYDTTQFYITLAGVAFLLMTNLYVFIKRNK